MCNDYNQRKIQSFDKIMYISLEIYLFKACEGFLCISAQ